MTSPRTWAPGASRLGSPIGVAVVVVVPIVWLLIRRLPRRAAYLAVTGLGAAVLGAGSKELVDRARPLVDVPLSWPSGASFPSGRTTAASEALSDVPEGTPRVVLMHNPSSFPSLPPRSAPLAPAGASDEETR